MFLSQARGKVGSMVFSVVRGQQIERVYNPDPKNPRSYGQQAQRCLLANMTKFYKRGSQNFYRFAYEDKTQRESDFNAFARKNMQKGVYMPKELYEHEGTPALGNYVIADGRISTNISDQFVGEFYGIMVPSEAEAATVGSLSAWLLTENPGIQVGDIFTMVMADSDFGPTMMSAGEPPTWQLFQFIIDPSDLRTLDSIGLETGATGTGGPVWVGRELAGIDRASFGAVVVSRQTTDLGLLVTHSEVKGSAVWAVLVDWLRGEYMRRVAAQSWGGNPEAVLQGGLIGTLPGVAQVQIGGGNFISAYTYGTGVFDMSQATGSIKLRGSNLRTSAEGARYVIKTYDASLISDGTTIAKRSSVVATGTRESGTNDIALTYDFAQADISTSTQYYILVEVDGVPVWYGLIIGG